MKCMCAQTRPQFILSSERVFGGMEFEPMLTLREKSPLPENVPRGGSNPRHCGQRAQALPTELFRPPRIGIGDGSWRSEEIVKKSRIGPLSAIIITIFFFTILTEWKYLHFGYFILESFLF